MVLSEDYVDLIYWNRYKTKLLYESDIRITDVWM